MPKATEPFVLLKPELLRSLLGALEFAGAMKIPRRAGERQWTLASLAAAGAHLCDGDLAVVCGNRRAATLLRAMRGSVETKLTPAKSGQIQRTHFVLSNTIAGMAIAQQQLGRGGVVLAFCGDAASVTGSAESGLPASAELRLPILWITQTDMSESAAVPVDGLRPRLPRIATDAEDAVAIYRVLQETIRQARTGGGPTWLDLQTEVPDTTAGGVSQPKRGRGRELSIEKMRQYLAVRGLLERKPAQYSPPAGSRPAVVEL